jgi:hypothetical protein
MLNLLLAFNACDGDSYACEKVLRLIEQGKIDSTHYVCFPLCDIEEAYRI